MLTRSHHRALRAFALAVLLLGIPALASADGASTLQTLRAELAAQSEQDAAGLAQDDIAQVTTWLAEADRHLEEGDSDEASYKLKRAEYGINLVRALTVASQVEAKAIEQETAFEQSDEQVATLKAEVEALQARKSELTQQLNQVR